MHRRQVDHECVGFRWRSAWLGGVFTFLLATSAWADEKLVIDFMISSGPQRTEWNSLLLAFKKANPGITVQQQEMPQEDYKKGFATRIKAPVDIALWFAGAQLTMAKEQNLVRPLDATTAAVMTGKFAPATLKAVSYSDQYFAVPLSYYQWGFFYKKSTFAKHGLMPPANWKEFQAVSDKLRSVGIKPTQIGAKNGWPAMAWFDYLDLRINGLDFHRKLLSGAIPFTDPKVVKVFEVWKELLERGDFDDKGLKLDWDEVLPYLYRDAVGMALMGAFAATKFPADMASDIGFFPFPQISAPPKYFEDAPLDVLVFPRSGQNPAAVTKFVKFLVETQALNQFNEATQLISPRVNAPPSKSATLAAGKKLLDSAAGISFFFDRDASPKLAQAGNKVFVEFLTPPHDVAKAIAALDTASR